MMDWNEVGKFAGPILLNNAPLIGSLLGGLIPIPGGSTIGEEAGSLLAKALGTTNDPTAVAAAIQTDPNAAAKITAAETEAAAKWPALAEKARALYESNSSEADSINQTMRAELAKGQPWYAWRNIYGYSITYEVIVVSNIVFYAILFKPGILTAVQNSYSFFLSWYTLRFGLLGYIHNQATQEKIAAATGQPPEGAMKSIIKMVKGK